MICLNDIKAWLARKHVVARWTARPQRIERLDLARFPAAPSRSDNYDLIIVSDLRFPGGSSQSTIEEVRVGIKQGWKIGLYHMPSKLVDNNRDINSSISDHIYSGEAALLNNVQAPTKTKVLLFRHPSILNPDGQELPDIEAGHVLLIVNHAPINLGRIDYLLPYCVRKLRQKYNATPKVFPIGPLVRKAIDEMYDGTVVLEEHDWVNVFDLERFACWRPAIDRKTLRIGRHSRPGREKWPVNADDIRSAYPLQGDVEVHILGGATVPDDILRGRPSNWHVHKFGALPPERFLSEIDVFVYFHHPDWTEAFGRAIVEAMASGLPVIVPPHFEPLLLDSAIYCMPDGVREKLAGLKKADVYKTYSDRGLQLAQANFAQSALVDRMQTLLDSRPAAKVPGLK